MKDLRLVYSEEKKPLADRTARESNGGIERWESTMSVTSAEDM